MYRLGSFINKDDFDRHVLETLRQYNSSINSIDLRKFNSNIIDPIKLLFDKNVYQKSFYEIINLEIHRQQDKTNNNLIGYFHQNMFKYIDNCIVPRQGWDVIFNAGTYNIFVEMKNKHNTMNSSSSQKTYINMQDEILRNGENFCYLVEVISPESRNVPWECSVNKRHVSNEHIRRVSIDQFYGIVTGVNDAFFKICMQLPETIEELMEQNIWERTEHNTIVEELRDINPDILTSLYLLAFRDYEGFQNL